MSIEYRIRLDHEFMSTSLARNRSVNHGGEWFTVFKWLCVLPLAGLVILLAVHGSFLGAALFAGFIALIALSGRIGDRLILRQFAKRGPVGEELTINLSQEGVHFRSSLADRQAAWSSITLAKRAKDGWLLFEEDETSRWLPDAATHSPLSEIETFLRAALGDRAVTAPE